MKTLKGLIALCILITSFTSVYGQDDAALYKRKIDKYRSWERSGSITTLSGTAVAVIGTTLRLVLNESEDELITVSYVVIGAGLATIIPGLIFRSIGKRKTKEYQTKLENLNTSFYKAPNHSGLSLTYTF